MRGRRNPQSDESKAKDISKCANTNTTDTTLGCEPIPMDTSFGAVDDNVDSHEEQAALNEDTEVLPPQKKAKSLARRLPLFQPVHDRSAESAAGLFFVTPTSIINVCLARKYLMFTQM